MNRLRVFLLVIIITMCWNNIVTGMAYVDTTHYGIAEQDGYIESYASSCTDGHPNIDETSAISNTTSGYIQAMYDGATYYLGTLILRFDTSNLSAVTVMACTLKIVAGTGASNDWSVNIDIDFRPDGCLLGNPLVVADSSCFSSADTTINNVPIVVGTSWNVVMHEDWMNPSGYTDIAMRFWAYKSVCSATDENYANIRMTEYTGVANDPKLSIKYGYLPPEATILKPTPVILNSNWIPILN